MRLPPQKLEDLLIRLEVCSSADLLRAGRIVHSLCRDLPDFESVWLDALVQLRVITPWQAEQLQCEQPDGIRSGEYLLRQPLGRTTFLAHHVRKSQWVVLTRIDLNGGSQQASSAGEDPPGSLQTRLESCINVAHKAGPSLPASLVVPSGLIAAGADELMVVSPWIGGWSCDELLIRGGRLPAEAVAEIGRDLLSALSWLEGRQMLHGDICLRNIRLTHSGTAVLVAPFVRRLVVPRISLTDQLTLRDCEGVSPEQIGTGRFADIRSELHHLGCVFWQLLTSRPVVLDADPVSRLIRLRDHDLADVRGFAPECPEWMARIIQQMTRRSPELRAQSANELLKVWKQHSGSGHRAIRAMIRELPEHSIAPVRRPVPSRRRRPARSGINLKLASAMLLLAGVFVAAKFGVLPQSLRWDRNSGATGRADVASRTGTAKIEQTPPLISANVASGERPAEDSEELTQGSMQGLSLPAPDAKGVIRLENGRSYIAKSISQPSLTLQIESPSVGMPALILVEDRSWVVQAESLTIRNVRISDVTKDSNSAPQNRGPGLLVFAGQSLSCELLEIVNRVFGSSIAWAPSGTETSIHLQNVILTGHGYGLRMSTPPSEAGFSNCLFGTDSSAILCDVPANTQPQLIASMDQITQRGGSAFLDLVINGSSAPALKVKIDGGESVFSPKMSIVRIASPAGWKNTDSVIEFRLPETGNPIVIPPDVSPVVFYDTGLRTYVKATQEQVISESLLIAQPEFAGPLPVHSSHDIEASGDSDTGGVPARLQPWVLTDFEGPKLSTQMPGIRLSEFPEEFWMSSQPPGQSGP